MRDAAKMKCWKQIGTKRAIAAICVFATAIAATATAKQAKTKAGPRPSPEANSRSTSILDTGYLGENIITPQDEAQANLPHLRLSNMFICNAKRGVLKAKTKTRVNQLGLLSEAGNGIIAPQAQHSLLGCGTFFD